MMMMEPAVTRCTEGQRQQHQQGGISLPEGLPSTLSSTHRWSMADGMGRADAAAASIFERATSRGCSGNNRTMSRGVQLSLPLTATTTLHRLPAHITRPLSHTEALLASCSDCRLQQHLVDSHLIPRHRLHLAQHSSDGVCTTGIPAAASLLQLRDMATLAVQTESKGASVPVAVPAAAAAVSKAAGGAAKPKTKPPPRKKNQQGTLSTLTHPQRARHTKHAAQLGRLTYTCALAIAVLCWQASTS